MSKTVIIYGAGAVGCVLAAAAVQNGDNLVLIKVKPAAQSIIAESGIVITGKNSVTIQPRFFDNSLQPGKKLFIITVKAYDLAAVIAEMAPVLTSECEILLVQNGFGIKELAQKTLAANNLNCKVYQAISAVGATLLTPGQVIYFGGGLRIEPEFEQSEYTSVWQNSFLKAVTSAAFQIELWRKLVINSVVNPLTALLDLSNHQLATSTYDRIKSQVLAESLAIAAGAGCNIDLSLDMFNEFIDSDNISSMLQDFGKGSQTEIDFINGALVKKAAELHIPAPCNQLLTNLIKVKSASIEATLQDNN